jgi:hypothetical protein
MSWLLLLVPEATAYEADNVSDRGRDFVDAAPIANRRMNAILDEAITATNDRLQCATDKRDTRRTLAQEIRQRTSRATPVTYKGWLRSPGYSAYQAWIEEAADIDREPFLDRHDIYGELGFFQAPILFLAGTCSTITLAGERIGTDKVDHFFGEGHKYFLRSHEGQDSDAALAWGTYTERTIFGLMTSATFSFADLRANFDGYRFFAGLLTDGSIVRQDDQGCATRDRDWRWTEWVSPEWDELKNPSVYTPPVQRGVTTMLEHNRDAVCDGYERWGNEVEAKMQEMLGSELRYVRGPRPVRTDPFDLAHLCGAPNAQTPEGSHLTSRR